MFKTGRGVLNEVKRRSWNPMMRYTSVLPRSVLDSAARDGELRIFMVAGEVSGDIIGSRLISSLKKLSPLPLRVSGVGGLMMRKEGLESIFQMEDITMMGIWELLPHLYRLKIKLQETVEHAYHFQPHAVVTVDFKGFCFRFLKLLRGAYRGPDAVLMPVHFHYVAPSFWAWKGGEERLKDLVHFVDHLLCVLPSEDEICRSHGLSASFVGHPALEDILDLKSTLENQNSLGERKNEENTEDLPRKFSIPTGALALSVLPGSRLQEVNRMLPIFSNTIQQLRHSFPDLVTIIHIAPNKLVEDYTREFLNKWPVPYVLVPGGNQRLKYDAFNVSQAALCTSGTVALELHLARLPFIVAYRAHILTEWFIRYKAKISYISLPNILTNSPIIPEVLFNTCQPSKLAALLTELITSKELRERQIQGAEKVTELLLPPEKLMNILRDHPVCELRDFRPSLVAASTILNPNSSSHS